MNIAQIKAPDWRWQDAMCYVTAQQQGEMLPTPSDTLTLYLIRILKAQKYPGSRLFLSQKMPELYSVYKLGTGSAGSAMRCELQAAIICFQQPQEVCKHVTWATPLQVRFYIDSFLDIVQSRHIRSWLGQYLLQPVQHKARKALFRTRRLALTQNYSDAVKSIIWGDLSDKAKKKLRQLYSNQRCKFIFDYYLDDHNIDPTAMATFMNNAISREQDRQFQKQLKLQDAAPDSSIAQIAQGIQTAIRGYSVEQREASAATAQDDAQQVIKTIIQE